MIGGLPILLTVLAFVVLYGWLTLKDWHDSKDREGA